MPRVFMSYRRDDTGDVARRLAQALKEDLGLDHVFLDSQDLWGGDDWRAVVRERIRDADAVVALVGHRWAGGEDGRRIFDAEDVVRWELRLALEEQRGLVPTMVDGARLPDELPPDIAVLRRVNWLDLDPSDSPVRYQVLLGDLFYKTVRQGRDVVIVTDDGDEADVHLDRLAALLKDGELGPEARELVRTASGGFHRLRLLEAATRWPDVIVLRDPDRSSAILDAREAGVRRNTGRVLVVSSLTGLLGVVGGYAAASASAAAVPTVPPGVPPPPPGAPPPPPPPGGVPDVASGVSSLPPPPPPGRPTGPESTPADPASATSAPGPPDGGGHRVLVERWRGLSRIRQGGVLAAGAVGAGVVVAVIWPDPPIVLVGTWDVTDFEEQISHDEVTSTVSVSGGRMRFEPRPGCREDPCVLEVTEGPQLLSGVVMEPVGNGSRYDGDAVPLTYTCSGTEVPSELTEMTLTATHGADDDTLEFVIDFALTEPVEQCEDVTAEYTATATRVPDG